jgi:hypothetical protein
MVSAPGIENFRSRCEFYCILAQLVSKFNIRLLDSDWKTCCQMGKENMSHCAEDKLSSA